MKVVVTRPADQSSGWIQALTKAGFETVGLPFIETRALALDSNFKNWLQQADAVMLVSASAVNHARTLIQNLLENQKKTRFWVTGSGTAKSLLDLGVDVDHIDYPDADLSTLDSKGLLHKVQPQLSQVRHVLFIRGRHYLTHHTGNPWLEQQLNNKGIKTQTLLVYERKSPVWTSEEKALAQHLLQSPAVWLLTSSEAIELAPDLNFQGQKALVTHEKIAKAAEKKGFLVQAMVAPQTEKVIQGLQSMK